MRRNFHKSLPQRACDINGARRPAAVWLLSERSAPAAPASWRVAELPAAAAQVACERTRTALNRDAIITATQVPFNSCIYYASRAAGVMCAGFRIRGWLTLVKQHRRR